MTTSQEHRFGRHAGPDEPAAPAPSVPAPSMPVQRAPSDAEPRALSVREYVEQVREPRDHEPGFGEWPYGSRKPAEPAGPNPYLPSEGATPEVVALPPGGWPGTAALVLGVAGLALALAPATAVIVWPLTVLGVVLGVLGVRRVRAGTARNGVAAITGTVFCLAGLAVCAAWLAMYTMAGVNTAEPAVGPAAEVSRQEATPPTTGAA